MNKLSSLQTIYVALAIFLLLIGNTSIIKDIKSKVQVFVSPFSTQIYSDINDSQSVVATAKEIKNLIDENSQLKEENNLLMAKNIELEELKRKITILEKEINADKIIKEKSYVPASVIGRSPSSFQDIVTIDKGSDSGIKVGKAVLSEGFLVGKIKSVTQNSSQIELISSHQFQTPVTLQDSRLLGLMKGGVQGIEVDQLPVGSQINIGENIITTGIADDLLPGLPVGHVNKILSGQSDIFQKVKVEIPVNLNRIEIVLVLIS